MTKEFVPYELALKLKQLGFDGPCSDYYTTDGKLKRSLLEYPISSKNNFHESYKIVIAPLFQQAFRWFRENHGLDSFCRQQTTDGHSYWKISKLNTQDKVLGYSNFTNTYEEAELACLDKLIEIVELKQQEP
jgi:hypothetical protein